MATLDTLLSAALKSRMDALVLAPGRRPVVRIGSVEREITQTALDGPRLELLLRELAPADTAFRAGTDLDFAHGVGGEILKVESRGAGDAWRVAFTRVAGAPPAAPAAAAALPAGATAAPPAATPAPRPAATAAPRAAAPRSAAAPPWPAAAPSAAPDAGPAAATPVLGFALPPPLSAAAQALAFPVLTTPEFEGSPAAIALPPPVAAAPAVRVESGGRPVRSVVELLEVMLERGASDLHLASDHRPRMRVHGDLDALADYAPIGAAQMAALLDDLAPERSRELFRDTHEADFAYELPGRSRFRVNYFRDHRGAGAVLRTIPTKIPTFEELALPDAVRKLAFLSKGLVLVTGPTGSGKSTTLAAIVDLVNRSRADHIITIEDPIEFVHPSKKCLVNQREVGVHTGSFKNALRAALREDPDIVLVGEMRDLETVAIAIETAETGHLVFGTLHTTTATSTIERLVDQFPGDRQAQIRMMLADSLKAVIAQTLLKKIGGGRVGAYEILMSSPAVANLIREGKTFQIASAMQTGKAQGMVRLNDALYELVQKKVVEPREAYIKAVDKEGLLQKLRAGDHDTRFLDAVET